MSIFAIIFRVAGWTTDRVASLAPDQASLAAGQAHATLKKWTGLGRSARAIWGECQGSGKNPYQARVDLSEPAFKCSCPSRKFPCKHALGLLLLFARDETAFESTNEPGWVAEWIDKRAERSQKKSDVSATPKPADAVAQAKRAAQRELRVRDGVASCRVWLEDLVRRGLAAAQADRTSDWDRAAARLVDAQAPGLASLVRLIPEVMATGSGWDVRAVDLIGRLHLLLRAAEQLDELPDDVAIGVRTALGWTQSREEALAAPGVQDRWVAIGQVIEDDERFRSCRTWLIGRTTGRRALILDFAAGTQPLERAVSPGVEFDGELAFYPGRQPLRAVLKSRADSRTLEGPLGSAVDRTIEHGMARYAEALAANPWTIRWPFALADVRPVVDQGAWFLVDEENRGLPLRESFMAGLQLWRLISASGGGPLTVIVEWDGLAGFPIAALRGTAQEYLDLAPRWTM